MTSVPALYYRLIKEDGTGRVLANPQLRTQVGMPAQAQFGERVPVPVTTFSPIATGGVNQQPITSFNYENIGVNIDITPRTHMNNDVTLALAISVTSISGTGFGGLPTFGNRLIKTTIRLKDGETNMLAGLIRDDERKVREGIPGLSDIPGVGRLFGHTRNERVQTDVILMLTPRIVRVLELTEEDVRAFKMGRDPGLARFDRRKSPGRRRTAGGIDLPLPDAPPDAPILSRAPRRRSQGECNAPTGAPHHAAGAAAADTAEPRPGATARLDMLPVLPPIVARACAHGTGAAIRDRSGTYTYEQLDRASASVAFRLLDGRDDLNEARVAFLVTPGFDNVVAQWGIWRAGGIAVPLPMSHPPAELEYLVRDSEASIVIADSENAPVVEPLAKRTGARFQVCEQLIEPTNSSDSSTPRLPRLFRAEL